MAAAAAAAQIDAVLDLTAARLPAAAERAQLEAFAREYFRQADPEDVAARSALRGKRRRITSALTFAEASRALVRARVAQRLTPADERAGLRWLQAFRRRCDVVAITDAVLARAGRPFPVEPIRTLDALHLATAELLGEPPQLVTIVTRDSRVIENARALGYMVE